MERLARIRRPSTVTPDLIRGATQAHFATVARSPFLERRVAFPACPDGRTAHDRSHPSADRIFLLCDPSVCGHAAAYALMKASNSSLIWCLSVVHIPCGAPGITFNFAF